MRIDPNILPYRSSGSNTGAPGVAPIPGASGSPGPAGPTVLSSDENSGALPAAAGAAAGLVVALVAEIGTVWGAMLAVAGGAALGVHMHERKNR